MRITADRRMNPMLAIILVALAAGWVLSAIGAASYARRHAADFSWSKKVSRDGAAKRRHISSYGDLDAVA